MSGVKLIGAPSPLKLLPSSNNILQPLQQTQNNDTNKNRNQNLLKAVNVTSARADSTGTENFNNFNSASSITVKGSKKTRGRVSKQPKKTESFQQTGQNTTQTQGNLITKHSKTLIRKRASSKQSRIS